MSEALPDFKLLHPRSVDEAIAFAGSEPTARFCAGGTDLIVNMRRGLVDSETLIDLSGIEELRRIDPGEAGIRIGAGVILRELVESGLIAGRFAAISQAAASVAGPGHREAATLGGNLCLDTRCLYYNQSHWWRKATGFCLKYRGDICHVAPSGKRCRAAFSGDLAPALMVLGAEVEIAGQGGRRTIAAADLYREDGTDYLTLGPGEMIVSVFVPATGARSTYGKIRVRGAIDFPLAGVAVACDRGADRSHGFAVAVTGTNSMPVAVPVPDRLTADDDPEAWFAGLDKRVQKTVSPQRTSTTAPHYRRLSIAALACRLARGLA